MVLTRFVIFDMDDTLFPESEFVKSGLESLSEYLFRNYGVSDFYRFAHSLYKEGTRGNIFNQVLDRIGFDYDEEFTWKLVHLYREHIPKISLYEDAKWALQHYKESKSIGLLTDGFENSQICKVQALGIQDSFDFIVYTDQLGRENWKPNKLPYLKMMENFRGESFEYVYIGDNPLKDFIAAKSLGWKTIHVCRSSGEYIHMKVDEQYEADYRISSLYELRNLI